MNKKRAPRRPQQCEPGRKRIRIDSFGEIGIEIDGLRAKREEIEDKNIRERKQEQMRRQEMLEHPPNKKMCKGDIRNYLSHKSTNLQPPPNTPKEYFPGSNTPQQTNQESQFQQVLMSAIVPVGGEEGGETHVRAPPP